MLSEDRIFLFVFGGRDATYADNELAYRNVRSVSSGAHVRRGL